jgi:hypothetical protein
VTKEEGEPDSARPGPRRGLDILEIILARGGRNYRAADVASPGAKKKIHKPTMPEARQRVAGDPEHQPLEPMA